MARQRKSTVDYFPHDTTHGGTIQILEARWGNDGYAFWFKLLELLGTHDGHFIDCRKAAEWELLKAKCRISEQSAAEILDCLAMLDAIDAELWNAHRIIFCEKFVARIADAYKKRADRIPSRLTVCSAANVDLGVNPQRIEPDSCQSGGINREREREREREIKEESKSKSKERSTADAEAETETQQQQQKIRKAFSSKQTLLSEKFPLIDLELEEEKCVAYYREKSFGADATLAVLNWCQAARAPKLVKPEPPPPVKEDLSIYTDTIKAMGWDDV